MQAIIYARFSTGEQGTGDSIARQLRACKPYAEAKGWEVDQIVTDDGRSGYKAHHRTKGEMGTLEREALDGLHVGKVLVVEQLSRLSREDHSETYDLIRSLTKNGLSIATVEGDRLYEAYKSIEFGAMIELIVRAQMYHEESASKSRHGLAKWEARRAAMASGRVVTKNCPPWLTVKPDRSGFEVIPDRVQTLQTMFDLADAGYGSLRICNKLNKDGVPPWPRYKGREPKGWGRGFILRLLTNPAVVGDHQSYRQQGDKRVPVGEPLRHYYPAIVAADVFERVNAAAADRKVVRGNKMDVPNLFAGMVRCDACDAVMVYRLTRGAGKTPTRHGIAEAPLRSRSASLVCPQSEESICANKRRIAYHSLEVGLLDSALHLALDDGAFARKSEVAKLDRQIADRQRDHDVAYNRAVELWEAAESQIAQTLAMRKEAEATAIKSEIEDLKIARQRAAGQVTAAEQLSRLDAIRDDLASEDEETRTKARLKVAQGFRAVITSMRGTADGTTHVEVMGGRRKLIVKPAQGRRKPQVWDFDFVHPARLDSEAGDAKVDAYLARSAKAKAAA